MKIPMLGARRIARIIRHAMPCSEAARNITCAATMVRPNTRVTWSTADEHVAFVCRVDEEVVVFRAIASTRWSSRPLDLTVCYYGGTWWVRDREDSDEPEVAGTAEAAFALAAVLAMAWLEMCCAGTPRPVPEVPVCYGDHSLHDYISVLLFL